MRKKLITHKCHNLRVVGICAFLQICQGQKWFLTFCRDALPSTFFYSVSIGLPIRNKVKVTGTVPMKSFFWSLLIKGSVMCHVFMNKFRVAKLCFSVQLTDSLSRFLSPQKIILEYTRPNISYKSHKSTTPKYEASNQGSVIFI